jgi:ABC-2 type transport system permease protein
VSVLQQNYITVTNLWLGNAGVPMDANLLVIAGPDVHFTEPELQQIGQYLREGGRLLVLFNYASQGHPTGLEPILQAWGVMVMDDIAVDADHTISTRDIVVNTFGKHPVVDALSDVQLQLYMPRPVLKLPQSSQVANAPDVNELFATSPGGTLAVNRNEPPHNYPLAVAVEQKPVAGVVNPRGNTRIIVVGDDIFLGNYYIDAGGNRDFLNASVNWLVDRPMLLAGIEPRPVTNFRLQITKYQQRQLSWLLLGAVPGSILILGWLVWFVRRK